jgi:molybdopterin molybdotransferase
MPLSPAEALRSVLLSLPTFASEDCPIEAAHGRVLREPVHADRALPPFDRITLDGYAVRCADVARQPPSGALALTVHGPLLAAGMIARELPAATADSGADSGAVGVPAIEVATGAVLPSGADAVIPYEAVLTTGPVPALAAETVATLRPGDGLHRQGSDHAAGDLIVPAGLRLTGREIAVAAACGSTFLRVAALPRIALISTGDELVDVGAPVAPHQIRRSNDLALRAALVDAHFPLVDRRHLRDVAEEIEAGLHAALAERDVVIVTGGVSKGRRDLVPETLEKLGVTPVFHGVAQRPGKPLWFGLSRRRTPVFALPGNPVSCFVCLHHYVLPALRHASGLPPEPERWVALASPFAPLPRQTRFVPVRLRHERDGRTVAVTAAPNTSGDFAGLVGTDGYLEVPPASDPLPAGTALRFIPWA